MQAVLWALLAVPLAAWYGITGLGMAHFSGTIVKRSEGEHPLTDFDV